MGEGREGLLGEMRGGGNKKEWLIIYCENTMHSTISSVWEC